jgi:hypothetical protein
LYLAKHPEENNELLVLLRHKGQSRTRISEYRDLYTPFHAKLQSLSLN